MDATRENDGNDADEYDELKDSKDDKGLEFVQPPLLPAPTQNSVEPPHTTPNPPRSPGLPPPPVLALKMVAVTQYNSPGMSLALNLKWQKDVEGNVKKAEEFLN